MDKALDSQSRGPGFETTGWLQSQLSFLSFQAQSIEYQELLETWELNGKRSKLSPRSSSEALRQLNPIKRGHKVKVFFMLQVSFEAHNILHFYTHICFTVKKPNFHFKG